MLQALTNGTNAALGQLMFENKDRYLRNFYKFEYFFQCFSCMFIVSAGAVTREFVTLYTINASDVNYLMRGIIVLFVTIQILSILRWPGVGAIKAAGMFKETQGRALTEMTINLLLSLILVRPLGMYGVLLATVVALFYRTIDVICFTGQRILKNSKLRRTLRVILLLIFSMCVFSVEYQFSLVSNSYIDFILHGIVFLALNSLLFGFFYFVTRKMTVYD